MARYYHVPNRPFFGGLRNTQLGTVRTVQREDVVIGFSGMIGLVRVPILSYVHSETSPGDRRTRWCRSTLSPSSATF